MILQLISKIHMIIHITCPLKMNKPKNNKYNKIANQKYQQ